MRKQFLFLGLSMLFSVAGAYAQDVITLHNGNDIQVVVQRVGIEDIEYKKFDNPNGPSYTMRKSDIFRIRYENGSIDFFGNQTPTTVQPERETTKCVPKNAFGLDLGIGAITNIEDFDKSVFTGAIGLRYLHHFGPYFGVDFLKINNKFSFKNETFKEEFWGETISTTFKYSCYNPQFMAGLRGNTPSFGNCMSIYGAFRLGIGIVYEEYKYDVDVKGYGSDSDKETFRNHGLCFEAEIGINITRSIFLGYSYNCQYDSDTEYPMHCHAARIGFNFGKVRDENRQQRMSVNQYNKPYSSHNNLQNLKPPYEVNTAQDTVVRLNGEVWNPDGIEMVWVEGTGSGITGIRGFYIGKYEVTQAQWQAVMGYNPSGFKGENHPVEKVSWNDVQAFIAELNRMTGRNYSLPTEEQWEYAAREGKKNSNYTYSGSNFVNDVAWYWTPNTHPVGQKRPNALGIYDMSGNVWEWCQDCKDYECSSRVLRGGSWCNEAEFHSVSSRKFKNSSNRNNKHGFRLVLVP